MKSAYRTILTGICAVAIVAIAYAGVIRSAPTAFTNAEGYITVTWQTDDETGVKNFQVWRAQVVEGNVGTFEMVGVVDRPDVKPMKYEFVDQAIFKVTTNVFAYKVRVMFQNGTYSDSEITKTSHLSSTAKRTWGSIKAMFR